MKSDWLSLAIATFGLTLISNPVAASTHPEVFTSGNRILKAPRLDVVVMDDFIYGEPQPLP